MKINSRTTIKSSNVILVPYKRKHVPRYHEWMKSSELQELTASEPLTLEEEYDMQKSWLEDDDKCTFIVLDAEKFDASKDEIASMIGDINLFLNDQDDKTSAEVEIMIAEVSSRGKGIGKETLRMMLYYGMQFLGVKKYTAKIGYDNSKSLKMFDKFGFKEESRSDYFKEVTLELHVADTVKDFITDVSNKLLITNDYDDS